MSEIMDYQQKMTEEELETGGPAQTFATVAAVYADGVSLLFDGEDEPSVKHYKVNTFFKYIVGQRVYIAKDSGTYVVLCAIGDPAAEIAADTAATATSADTALKADTADALGEAGSYAGETYITKANVGSSSYHWVIDDSGIYNSGSLSNYPRGSLGSSTKPINGVQVGGTSKIGMRNTDKIGFFGATEISQITLSTASANQGYTSATSSNYLNILNNIAGILKKLGLLAT